MFVYKEVWVHPSARWLWLMEDLAGEAAKVAERAGKAPRAANAEGAAVRVDSVRATTNADGSVGIRATVSGAGVHTIELRASDLRVDRPAHRVTLRAGVPMPIEWRGRPAAADVPWVAVVVPDGDVARRREVIVP
jgi:hypothetical protein